MLFSTSHGDSSTLKSIHSQFVQKFVENRQGVPIHVRKEILKTIYDMVVKHKTKLINSIYNDLNKPIHESEDEILRLLNEFKDQLTHIDRRTKRRRICLDPLKNFDVFKDGMLEGYDIEPRPKGVVLCIGTWNFPCKNALQSVAGAVAAGNYVLAVMPSQKAVPSVSETILHLCQSHLKGFSKYIRFTHGGRRNISELLQLKWNHIFFVGSPIMGKVIYNSVAPYLTTCTLELGGKCPCIITKDLRTNDNTDLEDHALSRVMGGKLYNTGQVCIGVDHLLVHRSYGDRFVKKLISKIKQKYGVKDAMHSKEIGKIVNQKQFERLCGIMNGDKQALVHGGSADKDTLRIEPTLYNFKTDIDGFLRSKCMQGEIFGPLLPIVYFDSLHDVFKIINHHPEPLATYVFAPEDDQKKTAQLYNGLRAGSITMNDTCIQNKSTDFPFGGIENSGVGRFYGEYTFQQFSHELPMVTRNVSKQRRLHLFKNTMNKIYAALLWLGNGSTAGFNTSYFCSFVVGLILLASLSLW